MYNIQSRNYAYRTSTDLMKCSCQFFSNYGLPCHNLLFFFIQENKEIPTGIFSQHWLDGCLEVNGNIFLVNKKYLFVKCTRCVLLPKCLAPSTISKEPKKVRKGPVTTREQYNMALSLFKKMADTLSGLAYSDFQEKLQLFLDIHDLIKKDQPIR